MCNQIERAVCSELRCLSCICAGCPIEQTYQKKPCNESTDPYECTDVECSCEIYDELQEQKEEC